jgi:hypothetical protein
VYRKSIRLRIAGWVSSILEQCSAEQCPCRPPPYLARSVGLSPNVITSPALSFSAEQNRVRKKSLFAASTILWPAILTPNTSMRTSLKWPASRRPSSPEAEMEWLVRK